MKTKIRFSAVVFSAVMLAAFASLPLVLYNEKEFTEVNTTTVIAITLGALFLIGLVAIVWFTKVISVNTIQRKVSIFLPFRLKTVVCDFDEIIGFRYKYLTARIDYKAVQLKTKDDKIYTISDFETKNLRQYEQFCLKEFEIKGDNFKNLTSLQKTNEIESSTRFDIAQAKEIKFFLFLGYAILGFVLFMIVENSLKTDIYLTPIKSIATLVILILIVAISNKLGRVQRVIKRAS